MVKELVPLRFFIRLLSSALFFTTSAISVGGGGGKGAAVGLGILGLDKHIGFIVL
jgi:hypothetical protein|tara:strand:- start:5218 stop:5382 length:165 start_codon:yes stop_codon:yes gene_type:complete